MSKCNRKKSIQCITNKKKQNKAKQPYNDKPKLGIMKFNKAR